MKLVKILSVFAVIAATGMVLTGCESPAGVGNGYNEAVFAEEAWSAGGPAFSAADGIKTISVKFKVLNGGIKGLASSGGIVSTQDDSHLVYGWAIFANDYTVTIAVPASDEYLNIRWKGFGAYFSDDTCLSAKMKAESGTITLDYNGVGKVATKNLYDVLVTADSKDWDDAIKREGTTAPEGYRIIKVKFDVKNGGYGLWASYGIVSTQDDSYLVYDHDVGANDFDIAIPVPVSDEYLNIRWKGTDSLQRDTYLKAKMKAESGTITVDYNGKGKVSTKNLYDAGSSSDWKGEWEEAKKRAVKDY